MRYDDTAASNPHLAQPRRNPSAIFRQQTGSSDKEQVRKSIGDEGCTSVEEALALQGTTVISVRWVSQ